MSRIPPVEERHLSASEADNPKGREMSDSNIRVKIVVDPVFKTIDKNKYKEKWEEHCDDEQIDMNADGSYPDVTDEFAIERYQEELENGDADLSTELETASVEVTKHE
jgi:hypothetical protein